jgi:hypothetical protein
VLNAKLGTKYVDGELESSGEARGYQVPLAFSSFGATTAIANQPQYFSLYIGTNG